MDIYQISKNAFLDACDIHTNVFDILAHVLAKVEELMELSDDEVERIESATILLAQMKSFCNPRKTVIREKIGSYPTFCGEAGVSQLIIDVLTDCGYDEDYIEKMEEIFYSENFDEMPELESVPCTCGVVHTPTEKIDTIPEKVGKSFEEPSPSEKVFSEKSVPSSEESLESPTEIKEIETQQVEATQGPVHFSGLTLNPPTYTHHHHIRPYKPRRPKFPRYTAPALRQRFWSEIAESEESSRVLSAEYHQIVLRIGKIRLNPKYILERGDIRIKMLEGCIHLIKTSRWDSDKLKAMKNAEMYFKSFRF